MQERTFMRIALSRNMVNIRDDTIHMILYTMYNIILRLAVQMEWGSRDLFSEYWAETIVLLISISCRLNYHPQSISSIQNTIKICSWTLSISWSFQWKKEKPTVFSFSAPITKTVEYVYNALHCRDRTLETEQYGASVQPVRYLHHLDALTPFLA